MKNKILIILLISPIFSFSQSDFEKILKSGEVIINGLAIIKNTKTEAKLSSKLIESVCIKNKLSDKVIFTLSGKDEDGNAIRKELVIQKDGKECIFDIQKGVYSYEIMLSNKEIFK
ncbi:DUF2141 domain-containing protein [Flavobacterium branchiophilum]|uniref:Uncharacterized protein n=1 Tax=Flavobacterium branchiophilum (strain FL-15) TaxID=1034807 RepID=G2Z6A4_FLABF|nr:hypothetical protein [Flavobacterium branchiophilum]CCB70924.1 Hypothetical protein precursor [Flavobacterium branchiophilum FL-15]